MRVEAFANFFRTGAAASPVGKLTPRQEAQSPLEAARQALLRAKDALDEQRDERMEAAMAGYQALRSRQTSYEEALQVQRGNLEEFQSLNSRCDALSEELTAARAEEAASPDLSQSRRVAALEGDLEAARQARSAFLDQANRYARGQAKYAGYLEKSGQGGYAAYEYQGRGGCTLESFASETSALIQRLETGSEQWRERVFAYCAQYGKTPYDFESYLQERQRLGAVYFAAQQRFSELLQGETEEKSPALSGRERFDTVEIGGSFPAQQVPDPEEQ